MVTLQMNFAPKVMHFVMTHETVYDATCDDFSIPVGEVKVEEYMKDPNTVLFLVHLEEIPIGYVSFRVKTKITAEMHGGFIKGFRGGVAKEAMRNAINIMFQAGFVKIVAEVASFNRPALILAHQLGFVREGINTSSFLKNGHLWNTIYLGVSRDVATLRVRSKCN